MLKNLNQLEIIRKLEKPEVNILSKSHLTEDIEEQEIQSENYYQYNTTLSNSTRTRGVTF